MEVYGITDGYQGMVDGPQNFVKMTWKHVSGILQKVCAEMQRKNADDFGI